MLWRIVNLLRLIKWGFSELRYAAKARLTRPGLHDGVSLLRTKGFEQYQINPGEIALERARSSALDMVQAARNSEDRPDLDISHDDGSVRILWKPKSDDPFNELFKMIDRRSLEQFSGHKHAVDQYMVQLSVPWLSSGTFGRSGYHIDSHGHGVKTYVYLSDVELVNGPLEIASGTGHLNRWLVQNAINVHMRCKDFNYKKIDPYLYYVLPENARYEQLEQKNVPLTGPVGSVINFDTRTLHKAGNHSEGERLVFGISWA